MAKDKKLALKKAKTIAQDKLKDYSGYFWDELKELILSKKFWRANIATMIGCIIFSYVVNSVVLYLKLVSPGITGLVVIFYYLTGWGSLSVIYIMVNIPIFIIGWRYISWRFSLLSMLGTIYFSIALELTASWPKPLSIADNILVYILFGSILAGFGSGIYLRYGGSIGGMDILAIVAKKKLGLPLSTTFNSVNALNLVGNFFIQDLRVTIFSAIYMFAMTAMIMKTQTGFSQRLTVIIISSLPEVIAQRMNQKLGRSSTFLKASGSYSHQEINLIYTVINNIELGRLKEIVYDIDPKALVSVSQATEVIGQKFISWEDEGYSPPKKRTARSKKSANPEDNKNQPA